MAGAEYQTERLDRLGIVASVCREISEGWSSDTGRKEA
jgi:hypothetical protein